MAPRLIVTVDNGIASHDGVAAAAALGIEVLITDHHLPAATLPAPGADRQSESARMRVSGQASRRRRRHVLRAARHARGAAGARPLRRPRGAESRRAARPRRARHRGRRRVPRPDQPDARRAGARAHPRRPRATRHPGAAGRRGSRSAPGDELRPGLRRRSAPQCRGPARPTWRSASAACSPTPTRRRCRSPPSSTGSIASAATSNRRCRKRRWPRSKPAPSTPPMRDAYTLCLFHPDWHQGVVGIVAGRLKDRYHRPAIVFARGNGGELKGSGRSIAGFHLRDALDLAAKRAPGPAREIRRPRVRRRPDARRVRPAAVRRDLRGDRPGAAVARAISRARSNRTARSRRESSAIELAARPARRGLGPGLPRPGVRRHVFRARPAHRRRAPLEARARPRQRTLRRDPVSPRGSAAAARSARPIAPTSTNGAARRRCSSSSSTGSRPDAGDARRGAAARRSAAGATSTDAGPICAMQRPICAHFRRYLCMQHIDFSQLSIRHTARFRIDPGRLCTASNRL